jgi:hypothetical protein
MQFKFEAVCDGLRNVFFIVRLELNPTVKTRRTTPVSCPVLTFQHILRFPSTLFSYGTEKNTAKLPVMRFVS